MMLVYNTQIRKVVNEKNVKFNTDEGKLTFNLTC